MFLGTLLKSVLTLLETCGHVTNSIRNYMLLLKGGGLIYFLYLRKFSIYICRLEIPSPFKLTRSSDHQMSKV